MDVDRSFPDGVDTGEPEIILQQSFTSSRLNAGGIQDADADGRGWVYTLVEPGEPVQGV